MARSPTINGLSYWYKEFNTETKLFVLDIIGLLPAKFQPYYRNVQNVSYLNIWLKNINKY